MATRSISREEIAEIHEYLSMRPYESVPLNPAARGEKIAKQIMHRKAASDIRDTDLLAQPLGCRTR